MNMIDHFICSLSVCELSDESLIYTGLRCMWLITHISVWRGFSGACERFLGWRINECFGLLRARWIHCRITKELNVFLMLSQAYIDQVIWLALGGLGDLHMMMHWVAPQQSLMRAALLLLMEGLLAGGSVVLGFGAPEERNRADQTTSCDCFVLNVNPFATDLSK